MGSMVLALQRPLATIGPCFTVEIPLSLKARNWGQAKAKQANCLSVPKDGKVNIADKNMATT